MLHIHTRLLLLLSSLSSLGITKQKKIKTFSLVGWSKFETFSAAPAPAPVAPAAALLLHWALFALFSLSSLFSSPPLLTSFPFLGILYKDCIYIYFSYVVCVLFASF